MFINKIRIGMSHALKPNSRCSKSSEWPSCVYDLNVPNLNLFIKMKVLSRRVLLCVSRKSYSSRCEEIKIPVPWGQVAAKWWGPKDKQPILASHGWQDNCGTYDTLMPMLPQNIGFLAYDFPGHGLSSKLPAGMFYHSTDGAILVRLIIKHFNWSKVSLMGHSLGSAVNFVYTMLYPETVNFLICLDALKPHLPDDQINRQRKAIDDFIKYDYINSVSSEPPSFAFDEMEKILHEGTHKQIALDACKHILKRNVLPASGNPDKFYFARDSRLKTDNIMNWSQGDVMANLHLLACPIFLYMASETPAFEKKSQQLEAVEALQKLNKDFEVYRVEGTHHVHLNNPERVAGLITSFLNKYAT